LGRGKGQNTSSQQDSRKFDIPIWHFKDEVALNPHECRSERVHSSIWPHYTKRKKCRARHFSHFVSGPHVDRLARAAELPEASIVDSVLKIMSPDNQEPEELEQLTRQAYAMLPRIKITDLLIEVDEWTSFTAHFYSPAQRRGRLRPSVAAKRNPR